MKRKLGLAIFEPSTSLSNPGPRGRGALLDKIYRGFLSTGKGMLLKVQYIFTGLLLTDSCLGKIVFEKKYYYASFGREFCPNLYLFMPQNCFLLDDLVWGSVQPPKTCLNVSINFLLLKIFLKIIIF